MINQVLNNFVTRSVDVEDLNFFRGVSTAVQKRSLTYLQVLLTYRSKVLKVYLFLTLL